MNSTAIESRRGVKPAVTLPEEAVAQLRALLDAYDRLRPGRSPDNTGDDQAVAKIRAVLNDQPTSLWWSDLAQAELCLADLLNQDEVRARLGGWRRRLHEVAGDARYAQYLTTAADLTSDSTPVPKLRADLSECIRAVYYFYSVYGLAARCRTAVTVSLFMVALGVLAFLGLCALLFSPHLAGQLSWLIPLPLQARKVLEFMIATSAAATVGSVVSVQRRLQDPSVSVDPFYRYIQTTADRFGVAFVSPVFGAIFGLLMYGLLVSGLLSTSIIKFTDSVPDAGTSSVAGSVAALLVFGFLAGFAEQLVPDALTRLAANALAGVSGGVIAPAPAQQLPAGDSAGGNADAQKHAETIAPPTPEATPEVAARGQDSAAPLEPNAKSGAADSDDG